MIKNITDPRYLVRQQVQPVKEHQALGLVPYVKAMILECNRRGLYSMCAPQAGLSLNFFIARSLDPRVLDFDVVFNATYEPVESAGTINANEVGPDGVEYKTPRWRKIRMKWFYHNGYTYEEKQGEFEGEAAYIAQMEIDHLAGIWHCAQ
jgi:peptide deformylase